MVSVVLVVLVIVAGAVSSWVAYRVGEMRGAVQMRDSLRTRLDGLIALRMQRDGRIAGTMELPGLTLARSLVSGARITQSAPTSVKTDLR